MQDLSQIVILDAVLMLIMVIYNAVALKLFWQSTLVFLVVYMAAYLYSTSQMIIVDETLKILPLGVAILLSYVTILVGSILLYVLLRLFYKKPYNKISFHSLLKRAK